MKKIITTIFIFIMFIGVKAYADTNADALKFFNNYVSLANSYDDAITKMYSPSAKIIRQVVKPDGTIANLNTNTDVYVRQLKLGQMGAKVSGYKNYYSDIEVTSLGNNTFKVSANRRPIGENYKLKMYQVIKKQPDGKYLIIEEMMQTKVQALLKYTN